MGHNDPLVFDTLAEPFLCLQRRNICGFVEQDLKMRSCFFVTVNVAICT